jgi:hypothetical protein
MKHEVGRQYLIEKNLQLAVEFLIRPESAAEAATVGSRKNRFCLFRAAAFPTKRHQHAFR